MWGDASASPAPDPGGDRAAGGGIAVVGLGRDRGHRLAESRPHLQECRLAQRYLTVHRRVACRSGGSCSAPVRADVSASASTPGDPGVSDLRRRQAAPLGAGAEPGDRSGASPSAAASLASGALLVACSRRPRHQDRCPLPLRVSVRPCDGARLPSLSQAFAARNEENYGKLLDSGLTVSTDRSRSAPPEQRSRSRMCGGGLQTVTRPGSGARLA